jgi:DNA-binding MarR family transcriptional regulator
LQLATISGINYLAVKSLLTDKPTSISSETPATNLLNAWWTFAQVMKRNVAPMLEREHQMDFGDFMVLQTIDRGANYPGLLCERASISPSGVSRMLENLTKRDLVRRSLDTEDSRRVRLEITPKGFEVLNATRGTMLRLVERSLVTLPKEQVQGFVDTLTHLAATMGETGETSS